MNEWNEKFNIGELTVTIMHDDDAESPRQWDNLGTMVCWHRRYILGDIKKPDCDPSEFNPNDPSYAVCLPLYLMDHSGISISTGSFHDQWDSGQVGWIYVTREKLLKEWSRKKLSKKLIEKARLCLISETETYDLFLTGQIYGYSITVEDDDGNETESLDSCWGFFGMDDVKREAREQADYYIKQRDTSAHDNLVAFFNSIGFDGLAIV